MATLHVLQGPDKGRTYRTGTERALIGRHAEQIQLTDHSVSRQHAELTPQNGSWIITDLGSSNGTFINGRRISSPTVLHHGDQVKVGASLMVFSGHDTDDGSNGAARVQDLVDIGQGSDLVDSSILSAVAASDQSAILQTPETADAVAAWNVIYRIAELIGTTESTEVFFEGVVDIIFERLAVDRLALLLFNQQTEQLEPKLVRYRGKGRRNRGKIVTSRTIINHVLQTRDGVLCANAQTDERFKGETSSDSQDSIHLLGLRSVICVPIIVRDEVYGVLHLDCSMSYHTYTHEQLRLVVAIGRMAGMAIENARLLEARMRTERLAAAGEAVAYLSHSIRNILQGLQSGAEVVELGIRRKTLDTVAAGWQIVRRNLDHTYRLAMNMLTFSKERTPHIESVQINKVVEDVVSLVQRRAEERAVLLLTELEEMPAIPTDANGMHQVIHNILMNAVDAAPADSGRVIIRTTYDGTGPSAQVWISDNGPGIPADQIEAIFEPFYSSKGHSGTGLGLPAVRKIVGELGGRVEVQSEPGEGTTFVVHLPAAPSRAIDLEKTHGPAR